MQRFKGVFEDKALTYEQFCERCSGIKLYDEKEMANSAALLEAEKAARAADAQEFAMQIEETRRDLMIDMALQKAGAKNIKAARALIDEGEIKLENGILNGADEQIETAKESCPYLFGKAAVGNPPPPKGGKIALTAADEQEKWRAEAGLPKR